jgi:hypothetical protein
MQKLSGVIAGITGVYSVAAELSNLGYIVTTTMRNAQGIDILVSNEDTTRMLAVQVKTNQGSSREWILTYKVEKLRSENLFYVFVNLNVGGKPDFFVVPARVVAMYVAAGYREFRGILGKKGSKHKDSSIRKFFDKELKFRNRWDLLGLDK